MKVEQQHEASSDWVGVGAAAAAGYAGRQADRGLPRLAAVAMISVCRQRSSYYQFQFRCGLQISRGCCGGLSKIREKGTTGGKMCIKQAT